MYAAGEDSQSQLEAMAPIPVLQLPYGTPSLAGGRCQYMRSGVERVPLLRCAQQACEDPVGMKERPVPRLITPFGPHLTVCLHDIHGFRF